MHIAICMDVAADRKQLERLLGRSCDRRLAADPSVPFYVQSYGNKSALFARPHMYDLFFIDILHDTTDSVQIIHQLRLMGVTARICYCPSKEDLSDRIDELADVMILKQPILKDELEKVLDTAVADVKAKVPRMDIHTMKDTVQIESGDLVYAEKNGSSVIVHLADGRQLESAESLEVFFERANAEFGDLYYLNNILVTSVRAVGDIGFSSVTMKDGSVFRIGHRTAKFMSEKISGN